MNKGSLKFGTAPVFFTAISTILGAILFLRFGYAVGSVGFIGVLLIILLAHLVTIPTSLAISEISTNKRVEGGGEYFIISRSFGLNIGATIGFALFLSQAISVAFYVIAFTEAFQFFFEYIETTYNLYVPRQIISVPVMLVLAYFIINKGAKLGVSALYLVVGILAISIVLFFLGDPISQVEQTTAFSNFEFRNADDFFMVFAIIFPAFTGMTAGVGLSGDLKDPAKSIPLGTITATFLGMITYFFISYKLSLSASPEELMNNQFVMSKIAIGGMVIIPLGLAASTISSALGSVMVAPRTLQALANDGSFPIATINSWLSKSRLKDGEPANASVITCSIAMIFVIMGDINAVARIISMFFMITYGSLCLISFLNHFGSSPSYRPSFKSKWYISLIGFLTAVWVMFKIDITYSILSLVIILLVYFYIDLIHRERKGISSIFANAIFQINRSMQLFLQKSKVLRSSSEWRPSVICVSESSFERDSAFRFINWISYKYGFGTYIHRINNYFSKETNIKAQEDLKKLIKNYGDGSHVYVDTIISPSYTMSIAQAIQIPSISGMENNTLLLEYEKEDPKGLNEIIDNYKLINSGKFDICILASSRKPIIFNNGIHVWIKASDTENANLMIYLSYILLEHPDWKKSNIKIFEICQKEKIIQTQEKMRKLLEEGRLPITSQNITILTLEQGVSYKTIINKYSADAGLTIIGFRGFNIAHDKSLVFEGFDALGSILFVNSFKSKDFE